MRNWKLKIACVVLLGPILWFAVATLTDNRSPDEVRYDQLVSARSAEGRIMWWRTKPWFVTLSKWTGFDPASHYQKKAEVLEESLHKSGALVGVSFYKPAFSNSKSVVTNSGRLVPTPAGPYFAPAKKSDVSFVRFWSNNDEISLVCRPSDLPHWQSAFCCITNRVSWGRLRKLGGNREEIMCQLPDGRIVELDACQQWLNESIAKGWMVGICTSNRLLLASRRRLGDEAR